MQERSHRALRASGTSGTGLSPKAAAEVLCEVVVDLSDITKWVFGSLERCGIWGEMNNPLDPGQRDLCLPSVSFWESCFPQGLRYLLRGGQQALSCSLIYIINN